MPSIADLYVTVMPETSKIADGIVRAFREVDPKATEAGRRWGREIQRGMDDVKVELKADTTKAKAEIDEAAKDKKATVEVGADTAKAKAEIDETARDRRSTIHLNVDKDRFGGAVEGELTQMGSRLAGSAASSGASIGTSMGAGLAPALMTAGIAALAGIASAASGIVGLMPAGLAGAGSIVATLAVGLDGVKDAWDAAGKAAQSSGKDQEEKTRAVASAQRSLKDAVLDESNAQKDVANARRDARQQLEDLNVQMRGGVIDEKSAILDAQAARRDLATGRFRDAIEYQQAQLRVEQADQRVLESHERNVHLQTQAGEANARGVEGSDQVVAANQRLAKAHENVAVAQGGLAEAQRKTSSAADSAAQAMAKLSPAAAAFVGTLIQMKPLWESFKNSVQDALFANMGPQIQQLATTYMPMLKGSFTTMASLINQAASAFMRFLEQPATMSMIQGLLTNLTTSFQQFMPVMQTIGQAFLQMTATGSAFLPQLGQIIGQMATMFSGFVNSGQFSKWMEVGLITLQQLTNMLPTLQPAIAPLANLFSAFITNDLAPLLSLFAQIGSTVISALAPAFTQWYQAMGPLVNQLIQAFLPLLQTLGPVLAQSAQVILAALIPAMQQLIPALVPVVGQIVGFYQAMLPLIPSLIQLATSVIPVFTDVLTAVLPIVSSVIGLLRDAAEIAVPALSFAISELATNFQKGWHIVEDAVKTAWNAIKPVFDLIKGAIHDLGLDTLLDKLGKVTQFLPNVPNVPGASPGTAPAPTGGGAGTGAGAPSWASGLVPFAGGPTAGNAVPGAAGAPGAFGPSWMQGDLRPGAVPASPSGFDWDAVAAAESGGNWANGDTGHNGHYGGLQFAPDTWAGFGGLEFADRADHATPLQQKIVADRAAFTGWKGQKPQGLGAWQTITDGKVPGVTTSTRPPNAALPAPAAAAAPTIPGVAGAPAPTAVLPGVAGGAPGGIPGLNLNTPGKAPEEHLQPGAVQLNRIISQLFPQVASIGGWREHDPFPDHPSGRALDIMVGNDAALGNAINQYLQQHAAELGIDYTLWQQQTWKPGQGPTMMENRGSPTENHMDHVHAMVKAGAAADASGLSGIPSAGMPTIASPNGLGLGTQQSPMYVMPAQSGGGAQQFGEDFLGGILEIFGLDGSVFKNPLGSGLFKSFKGVMSLLSGGGQGGGGGYPASAFGGDGASLLGGGGGGGPLGGLGAILSGLIPAGAAGVNDVKQVGGGSTFNIHQQGMFLDQPQATDQIRQAAYTGTAWHNSMTSPAIMA
jgi:hypothetical protein